MLQFALRSFLTPANLSLRFRQIPPHSMHFVSHYVVPGDKSSKATVLTITTITKGSTCTAEMPRTFTLTHT